MDIGQVVLTETVKLADTPFFFDLNKLNDNSVKTGTVDYIVITIKSGELLFCFEGKTPTQISSFNIKQGQTLIIKGIEDILKFRAIGKDTILYINHYK